MADTPADSEPLVRFEAMDEQANLDAARTARQHARGKLTVTERLELLFDPDSFTEMGKFVTHRCTDFGLADKKVLGDGIVTGHGTIAGRVACVFAHDFTAFGGSLSGAHAEKICRIIELALEIGAPIIGLSDSGGARMQTGVDAMAGYTSIFRRQAAASGVVPQITAILGPCVGGSAYSSAMTDFIFMVEGLGHMFLTSPDVVEFATQTRLTKEELGGTSVHTQLSGVAQFAAPDEITCLHDIRRLLSYLPSNNTEDPPPGDESDPPGRCAPELDSIVPREPNRPYDVKAIITSVFDHREFFEVSPNHARNIVVGFARLDSHPVGVVANQPAYLAGCLDIDASAKASRFVRFCNCFNLPIVTFVDVPGFLPGATQEQGGIIRHGAKMAFAYAEASVPKLTCTTRKSYGGAYTVMSPLQIGGDVNLAYPTAELGIMGAEPAVNYIYGGQLRRIEDPDAREAARKSLVSSYREQFSNPYVAAARGFVDQIIQPARTRPSLIEWLRTLSRKRHEPRYRKHNNITL